MELRCCLLTIDTGQFVMVLGLFTFINREPDVGRWSVRRLLFCYCHACVCVHMRLTMGRCTRIILLL